MYDLISSSTEKREGDGVCRGRLHHRVGTVTVIGPKRVRQLSELQPNLWRHHLPYVCGRQRLELSGQEELSVFELVLLLL